MSVSLEAVGVVGAAGGADSGGVLPSHRDAGVGEDGGGLVAVGVVGAGGGADAGRPLLLGGRGRREGEGEDDLWKRMFHGKFPLPLQFSERGGTIHTYIYN